LVIEDINTLKVLEDNFYEYVQQRKENKVEITDYNYIFSSKDKKWNIDFRVSKMNDVNTNFENFDFVESKAHGIFKYK